MRGLSRILSTMIFPMLLLAGFTCLQTVYPFIHPTIATVRMSGSVFTKDIKHHSHDRRHYSTMLFSKSGKDDEDESINEEGRSLAADFFQILQSRNISLNLNEVDYDEDDEEEEEEEEDGSNNTVLKDDDEDDEEEEDSTENLNIPQSAINVLRGIDSDGAGTLAGDPSITDRQVYDELKERVLESAGSFLDLVGTSAPEEDGDEDDDEDSVSISKEKKEYTSPEIVPDSGLTAGEVVMTVLDALRHNDIPYPNRGVEVLLGYSSPTSAVSQAMYQGMTPEEYGDFLKEEDSEYKVLFDHEEVVIDKGNYSVDKKKAFFTARVRVGPHALDFTSVNFILTVEGDGEDDCWLIDSMLIRPEGMRRRRRR